MRSFEDIYQTAVMHKGSVDVVEANLPKAKSPSQLKKLSDAHYLSEISRRIFRAGLKHEMVDKKWPAFDKAFKGFDIRFCAMLSDEDIESYMDDKRLIRHMGKIKSIRSNAQFIENVVREYNSFGDFLAGWPVEEIVELWFYLKKHGAQLGGRSGSLFLRMVGKDTFILTDDVVAVLKAENIVSKTPTSQRDIRATQDAFNQWKQESGRPMCEISRIVSMTSFGF